MKISDVEFYLVDVPLDDGPPVRSLVARLSAGAIDGWGESTLAWRADELRQRRDLLLPLLAGRSVFDIAELAELDALAPAGARAAVEMACWDLAGRALRVPVSHLWGGEYRARIPFGLSLPAADTEKLATLAREWAEQGFHALVMSTRADVERDIRQVRAVREAVGHRVALRLDIAGRYSLDAARELCLRLEPFGVEFVLDPFPPGELESVARLRRQTNVPIALARGIERPADVFAAARLGVAAHVAIDISRVGGPLAAIRTAAVGGAAGLAVSLRSTCGAGIELAAIAQLAAAVPCLASSHECRSPQPPADLLTERFALADGMIRVPQAPGWGVEVDRAKLEARMAR